MAQSRTYLQQIRGRASFFSPRIFLNWRMLGFALSRTWVYMFFLGPSSSKLTLTGDVIPSHVFFISCIFLCATLFLCAFLDERFTRFVHRRFTRFIGPIFTAAGSLSLFFISSDSGISEIVGIIGGILTGIGSGSIDLAYGDLYRKVPSQNIRVEVPFAYMLAAFFYVILMFLPSLIDCICCFLIPFISCGICFFTYKIWQPDTLPITKPVEIKVSKFAWRIAICAMLVGIAESIVREIFMSSSGVSQNDFYQLAMVVVGIFGLLAVWAYILFSPDTNFRNFYKAITFLMAFVFLLLPVLTTQNIVGGILSVTGYSTFNLLIWILLAEMCSNYRLSSNVVFGIGWGMLTAGVCIGQVIASALNALAPFSGPALSFIALVATCLIFVSYLFVFTEHDLEGLTDMAGEDTEKEAETTDRVLTRTPFKDRCRQLAEECSLTPRETEIMILFAKGRSSARIQEELFLSRGTVTTHLRHIYQKLDVHSKQEMLDLIEHNKRAQDEA